MIYRELPWDSAFFRVPIASVTVEPADSLEKLESILKVQAAECLYLMLPHPLPAGFLEILSRYGAECFDKKTIFEKEKLSYSEEDPAIQKVHVLKEDCVLLAISSGWKSRFFLDQRFRSFQPMLYRRWVENYFDSAKIAGVWEYRLPDGELAGMVCASCEDTIGKIGLIAVAPPYQGRGIGIRLMRKVENFYLDHGNTVAEVVTQLENTGACRLYERCGYTISRISEVWHLWSQNNLNQMISPTQFAL